MSFSYPVILIALMLFFPVILPWIFTYILYFGVDFGIALYVFKKCNKKELVSPMLYLAVAMVMTNTVNMLAGYCKLGNYILGAMNAFFLYGMERCLYIQKRDQKLQKFIHQISQIAIVVNVLSFLYLLLHWKDRNIDNYTFLFGSKFNSSYILLLGIVLYYANRNRNTKNPRKLVTLLLIAYCAWFSWSLNCITAVILTLFVLAFVILPSEKFKNILRKPVLLGAVIAATGTFSIWSVYPLRVPWVQKIITEVFHRNLGLTGRLYIYSNVIELLKKRLLIGYGNGTRVVEELLGFGNSQNGMIEFILKYGIFIAIGFALIIIFYLKMPRLLVEDKSWIFFGLALGMILVSTVEVVYDSIIFYFAIYLCYYSSVDNIQKFNKHNRLHKHMVI